MASKESIDSAVLLFQACFLRSLYTLPSPIFNMFNPSTISSNLSQQQERWFGSVWFWWVDPPKSPLLDPQVEVVSAVPWEAQLGKQRSPRQVWSWHRVMFFSTTSVCLPLRNRWFNWAWDHQCTWRVTISIVRNMWIQMPRVRCTKFTFSKPSFLRNKCWSDLSQALVYHSNVFLTVRGIPEAQEEQVDRGYCVGSWLQLSEIDPLGCLTQRFWSRTLFKKGGNLGISFIWMKLWCVKVVGSETQLLYIAYAFAINILSNAGHCTRHEAEYDIWVILWVYQGM